MIKKRKEEYKIFFFGVYMKKKIIITTIILIILSTLSIIIYNKWRIANAKIIVELVDNLEIEVYSDTKLSDLIKSINGKLIDDYEINTNTLGVKPIDFNYINDDDIKVSYSFNVKVVDKTPPVIFSSNTLTITQGSESNLEKELFCGDNYDDKPKCEIIGNYDLSQVGNYVLTFVGTDSSNNISTQEFLLTVKEKNTSSTSTKVNEKDFSDIVNKYKSDKTKIGLDVSKWQGDIDFEKVKNAGVEFVFIRVGTQKGIGGEYILDPKFEQNITGFQNVGIPVGVYFYSYANSTKSAKEDANWVIRQLQNYNLELPVVFDWENWSFYQEFNKSFYNLTQMANTFLSTIEKNGYKAMLYSSKNYLEKVWLETKYPIWLAHYTEKTNYQGTYKVWQLTANGKVQGISGNVDINVMYD